MTTKESLGFKEYDIYYTEYAYPILAPISLAEIGTEEELEKYR